MLSSLISLRVCCHVAVIEEVPVCFSRSMDPAGAEVHEWLIRCLRRDSSLTKVLLRSFERPGE